MRIAAPVVRTDRIAIAAGGAVVLRSSTTGRVVVTVRGPGAERFRSEEEGPIVLAPDAKAVYSTLERGDRLYIGRLTIPAGRLTLVAPGEDVGISPAGDELAYATPSGAEIAIRNVGTGAVQTVAVADLIGPDASLLNTNSPIAFLGEQRLVALPQEDPAPTGLVDGGQPGRALSSSSGPTCASGFATGGPGQCALIVDLAPRPVVHIGFVGDQRRNVLIAGGAGNGHTLLVGAGFGRGEQVQRFDVTATAVRQTGVVPLDDQVLVSFSPRGGQVLYVVGPAPIQLCVASFAAGKVTATRVLAINADVGGASW